MEGKGRGGGEGGGSEGRERGGEGAGVKVVYVYEDALCKPTRYYFLQSRLAKVIVCFLDYPFIWSAGHFAIFDHQCNIFMESYTRLCV